MGFDALDRNTQVKAGNEGILEVFPDSPVEIAKPVASPPARRNMGAVSMGGRPIRLSQEREQ